MAAGRIRGPHSRALLVGAHDVVGHRDLLRTGPGGRRKRRIPLGLSPGRSVPPHTLSGSVTLETDLLLPGFLTSFVSAPAECNRNSVKARHFCAAYFPYHDPMRTTGAIRRLHELRRERAELPGKWKTAPAFRPPQRLCSGPAETLKPLPREFSFPADHLRGGHGNTRSLETEGQPRAPPTPTTDDSGSGKVCDPQR